MLPIKLYQIIFSFVEPCQAVATFAAENEEDAVAQLRQQAESQVTDLEIEQVTEIGHVDEVGTITPLMPVEETPSLETPDNVIPFPGTQTRH